MSKNTVILSPECIGKCRREAIAGSIFGVGAFVTLNAAGAFVPVAAGAARQYITTENISSAGTISDFYAVNEGAFAAALPSGCRVNAIGVVGSYAIGDLVEVSGTGGAIGAATTGAVVGVVVKATTITTTETHITIDLF